jgi:hypothetical protein
VDLARTGVAIGVRQRLRDDVVRRGLDRRRKAPVGEGHDDRDGRPLGEALDGGREPRLGQDRRHQAAHQLTDLGDRVL